MDLGLGFRLKWLVFLSVFICACGSGRAPKLNTQQRSLLGPAVRAQEIEVPIEYHVGDVAKFEITKQVEGQPEESIEKRTIEILSVSKDQLVVHLLITKERMIRGQLDVLSFETKKIRMSTEQRTYHNLNRTEITSDMDVCRGCSAVEMHYTTAKWFDHESYEKSDWHVIVANELPSFARQLLSCQTREIDSKPTRQCQKLISFHAA